MVVYNNTTVAGCELKNSFIKNARKNAVLKSLAFFILPFFCIYLLVTSDGIETTIAGIIFLVIDLVALIFSILQFINVPKYIEKQNPYVNCDEILYKYTFKEQSFILEITTDKKKMKGEYSYPNIKKVLSDDKRYKLIMKDNVVFYIDKNGFTIDKGIEFFLKDLQLHKVKIIDKNKDK